MPKSFDTETEVKSSTSVSQKLAIAVMMLGALSAAMGIVVGLPIGKVKPITGPIAFRPLQLSDGAPSTKYISIDSHPHALEYQFLRDNVVMATYAYNQSDNQSEYSVEDSHFQSTDNYIDPASKSPLQVKINQNVKESADIPALTFSLVTDIGSKTLCLPSGTLTQNVAVSYYYDVDGTPYFDSKLTKKAMNSACQINTRAYAPTMVNNVNFNEPYPESIPGGFGIYFTRYDVSFFAMTQNTFQKMTDDDELNFVEGGKAAFVMYPGYHDFDQGEITVPARLYTVNPDLGTLTLCFPEQTITGEWWEQDNEQSRYFGRGTPYYYDTNGTPYTDALLTNMATTKPCNELLVNAFKPYEIIDVVFDSAEDFFGEAQFFGNNVDLGTWYFDNSFQPTNNTNDKGNDPLSLNLKNIEAGANTFSAHAINLAYKKNSTAVEVSYLTLCLPETSLAGNSNTPYYYDTNGTPYTDALLENSVACGFCSDGTYMGECNSSQQYCDPDTLQLKYVCDKCGYECEPGSGSKEILIIETIE